MIRHMLFACSLLFISTLFAGEELRLEHLTIQPIDIDYPNDLYLKNLNQLDTDGELLCLSSPNHTQVVSITPKGKVQQRQGGKGE